MTDVDIGQQTQLTEMFAAQRQLDRLRLLAVASAAIIYLFLMSKAGTLVWLAYALIVLASSYSLAVYAFEPRGYPRFFLYGYLTLVADATLAILWLYATGSVSSPFYVILYLAVISISFRSPPREAIVASALYAASYLGLIWGSGGLSEHYVDVVVRITYLFLAGALGFALSLTNSRDISDQREAQDRIAKQAWVLQQMLTKMVRARDREHQQTQELRESNEQLKLANQQVLEDQQKLIQAEKLASVGLLAAGVAHEVNNPLTGTMTCVQLLKTGRVPDGKREHYFEVIENSLRRIATIVSALLQYSRKSSPLPFEPVDIHKAVSLCLPLLQSVLRSQKVEIDLQLEPERVWVLGNATQLTQAAMNVLMNAIHASPPDTRVRVLAERRNSHVDVIFVDQGIGIAKDNLVRVCDPFFTTKPEGEGTGLGLTVTQGILHSHSGELRIESEEGKGTRVTFSLPTVAQHVSNR